MIVTPLLGPRLLGNADQRFARYLLLNDTTDRAAWSEEDIEVFVARFREPARARADFPSTAASSCARPGESWAGIPEHRLTTPTRLLAGAQDPVVRPRFLGGYQDYPDDLALEIVDGASHFIADERPAAVVEHALELFAPPDHRGLHR